MIWQNTAKRKMRAGEAVFGYSLGLGSALVAEALAGSGIDFLMIDTQHGSFGSDSAIAALMATGAGGATPMVRVAFNEYTRIGRLLDDGALGVVVPMVNDADDAHRAASACRLPPTGDRSFGWGRAVTYGDDYADRIDDEVFVAVQIESARAVENAEAIMATPGIDGCWIGPSDLALSMGVRPRDGGQHDGVQRAIERVLEACRNTDTVPGYAAFTPADAAARAAQGFRFLTAGSDRGFLMEGARAGVAKLAGSKGAGR
ncbi:MAG: 2,4-dihydroxyhept-2-ene-1,7-dioic acid aldolase [Chloroflexia bacterium]|nr:2,4-dihydroxyhept-2-ene-1,7-dioic acid aldolase [Chloroflexia bacterium]